MSDKSRILDGRSASQALFAIMGLALLAAVVFAPLGPNVAHAQPERISPATIKWTLYTLKDEYIEKTKPNELLKAAAYGVKVYLKRHKLKFEALDKFPHGHVG